MTTPEPRAALSLGTLSDQEIVELAGKGALITDEFEQQSVQQAC
jgi:hypothetical protein